ncbi:MAG: hypothetical protein ABIJ00_11950 [Candidatus Eisenbacteria bacterium]
MKRKLNPGLAVYLSALLLVVTVSWAISISATGSWTEAVDESDLAGPPGSDLNSTFESASDQISIDITETQGDADEWLVSIKRVDTNWHANLQLYAMRTSDGSGTGSISGGTAYKEVTTGNQSFFSGSGDRAGVGIQQKITGVSIQLDSDTYSTTVYYTLIDM